MKSFNILVRSYLFLKNYATLEGAVSHNVLYYQQLFIARYKVSLDYPIGTVDMEEKQKRQT